MRHTILCALGAALSVGLACGSQTQASVIVGYTFDTMTKNLTGPEYNPKLADPGLDPLVSAAVGKGAGNSFEISNEATQYASGPELRVFPGGISASTAIAANSYWEFTVKPADGQNMDLTDLQFDAARGGGGVPRGWAFETSVDGFGATTIIQQADLPTARPNWTHYTIDLSAAKFQNLTTATTFRVYVYSPASGSTVEFDNVSLNGTIAPEPATLALMGLGGLALVRRRRK